MKSTFKNRLPSVVEPRESLELTDPLMKELPPVRVTGELHLRGMKRLTSIPDGDWHTLCLRGCPALTSLPHSTRPLQRLELDGCGIERLPADLRFATDAVVVLQNCHRLTLLPDVVSDGELHSIVIRNCPRLTEWPALSARRRIVLDRMPVTELPLSLTALSVAITRCSRLKAFQGRLDAESVSFSGCAALESFVAPSPGNLKSLTLAGCRALKTLPDGLKFSGNPAWLDLDGCAGITALPADLKATPVNSSAERRIPLPALVVLTEGCPLRKVPEYRFLWHMQIRGVQMNPNALLHPEGIDPSDVLRHRNAEVRRVLLENMGMENLLARTDHAVIDEDTDAGGQRRLFHFCLPAGRSNTPGARRRADGLPSQPIVASASESAGAGLGGFIMRLFGAGKHRTPASPSPSSDGQPPSRPGVQALRCRHLECRCPSTGRLYLLPVPPGVLTCSAAAAWLAGFDNPNDYAPVLET